MGQQDVIDLLKTNKKKWWSLKEIQTALSHVSAGSVCVSVKKLKNSAMVKHELRTLDTPLNGGKNRREMSFIKWKE